MPLAPNDLTSRAITAYGHAVRMLDPIRFRLWTEHGLTMPQARVLFAIFEDGEQSAGELAERHRVTPSTITGLTDRLVRQGLVARREDLRDRRIVRLGLTDEGRRVVDSIVDTSKSFLEETFRELPAGRLEQLTELLEELVAANERLRAPRNEVPA